MFLSACQDDVNTVLEDSATFDAHVLADDGTFIPVHAARIRDRTDITWDSDRVDVHFPVLRPDALPLHLTLSADLSHAPHHGTELPVRLCVCHVRDARPNEDLYCDDDEIRTCADVLALLDGERDPSECRGDDLPRCIENFDLTLTLPEGGEFFGVLHIVHHEDWTSGWL
ncbi:MAG: hypothetical protein U0414_23820 [Polyangiaceae bacterium]